MIKGIFRKIRIPVSDIVGILPITKGGTGLGTAGGVANRVLVTVDGSVFLVQQIVNAMIADGTIDLLVKGTYVPVNKAGDTMVGNLVVPQVTSPSQPRLRAWLFDSQLNLINNIWTKILLDMENYDIGNNFVGSTFTVPVNGYYLVIGNMIFSDVVADTRYSGAIYVNGVNAATTAFHSSHAQNIGVGINDTKYLTAGQTVELYARQNSGGNNVDILGGSSALTYMAIALLG